MSLQNDSNRQVRLKAFLRKSTIFTAQGQSATDQWTLLSFVSNPIPAHTIQDWNPSDEIPSGNVIDCRLIKHHYVFVICATIVGARKLSLEIPIKVRFICPRNWYEETEESIPLTSQPVIGPTDNESSAPLTMSTQFAASNPFPPTSQPFIHPTDNESVAMSTQFTESDLFPPQPPVTVFPLVPHPGSRNPLPVQPDGVIPGESRVVPSAPYPEASDPLSYQSGVVPSAPYPAASDTLSYQPGVVPSAPYPSASNPLSYHSGVVPSEFESSPLRPAIYDTPPPYSSHPDLNDPHLQ